MSGIEIQKVATLITTSSWDADIHLMTALFGAPTTVQEGEWAQFDASGGFRLCVEPADARSAGVGLMVKVADVEAAAELLAAHGCHVGEPTLGAHERQVEAITASGQRIVAYSPRQ